MCTDNASFTGENRWVRHSRMSTSSDEIMSEATRQDWKLPQVQEYLAFPHTSKAYHVTHLSHGVVSLYSM